MINKFILVFILTFANIAYANNTRLVVTSGAGGITHRYSLIILPVVSESINKNILLEIKSGAEGYIAAKYVNTFRHSDSLILMIGSPKDWKNINGHLNQIDDFNLVSYLGYMPHLLLTSSNISLKDILAKGINENISYAISINNPARPLIKELVRKYSNDNNVVEITFKSGSEVIAATLGGHVNFGIVVPEVARLAISNKTLNVIGSIGTLKGYERLNLETQGFTLTNIDKYLNHVFLWSNLTTNTDGGKVREATNNYLISNDSLKLREEWSLTYNLEYLIDPEKLLEIILKK